MRRQFPSERPGIRTKQRCEHPEGEPNSQPSVTGPWLITESSHLWVPQLPALCKPVLGLNTWHCKPYVGHTGCSLDAQVTFRFPFPGGGREGYGELSLSHKLIWRPHNVRFPCLLSNQSVSQGCSSSFCSLLFSSIVVAAFQHKVCARCQSEYFTHIISFTLHDGPMRWI